MSLLLRLHRVCFDTSTNLKCELHIYSYSGIHNTVGLYCQGIPQKVLQTFDTSFDTKMMVKSGAIEIISNPNGPGLTSFFGSIGLAS